MALLGKIIYLIKGKYVAENDIIGSVQLKKKKSADLRSSVFKIFIVLVAALFVFEVFCKIISWITCKESWWWWGNKCDQSLSIYKVSIL